MTGATQAKPADAGNLARHSNQPSGPIVPITAFLRVSDYPSAAVARQELVRAKQDLVAAQARKDRLDSIRARRFPTPRQWYERERFDDRIYDPARWHLQECWERLEAVEEAAGLFHPKHRARLEGWIESAVGLLDALDSPEDPDTPDYRPRSDGLPGDPADHESAGDDKDIACLEWSGLSPHQRRAGRMSWGSNDAAAWVGGPNEDDEDDDPSGQCDEDGVNTNLSAMQQPGPGCAFSDPGGVEYQ